MFKFVWSLVKNFFDPHVRELIQVAGHSDYMELLDRYIDREMLPPVICPEDGVGKAMSGYYENVEQSGGPVPKEALAMAKAKPHGYGSQCRPIFPNDMALTPSTAASTPRTVRSFSAPMPPPTSDDDDEDDIHVPSSPVTTTPILAGYWDDDDEFDVLASNDDNGSVGTKSTRATIRAYPTPDKRGYASPMFKYNW